MAKLILSHDAHSIDEFSIEKECITIGRKPDNDIQIHDKAVSGYHCQIITVLNDSFLEDLHSTNGTFVNTRKITKYALHHLDKISLGTHVIQYINDLNDVQDEEHDYDKTMILRTSPHRTTTHPTTGKISSEANGLQNSLNSIQEPATPIAQLEILNGSNKGKLYKLSRPMTTLGKPGSQVAVITRRAHNYVIIGVEADSTGLYPRLNGIPVSVRSMPLSNGDAIEVAGIQMTFHHSN